MNKPIACHNSDGRTTIPDMSRLSSLSIGRLPADLTQFKALDRAAHRLGPTQAALSTPAIANSLWQKLLRDPITGPFVLTAPRPLRAKGPALGPLATLLPQAANLTIPRCGPPAEEADCRATDTVGNAIVAPR